MTLAATALHVARSGLVDLGNEALPHVNDPPVHLVACVHALGCEPHIAVEHARKRCPQAKHADRREQSTTQRLTASTARAVPNGD